MKFFIMKLIKYLLIPFGVLYNLIFRSNYEIKILMYHRVNDDIKKELSVKKKNFLWQMDYLKRKGYRVISMDEAYQKIKTKKIDNNYIVLTFDDGYKDFKYNAYEVLKKHRFNSILYIVPGFIDTHKVYWWDEDIQKSELLSWNELKEISLDKLVEIGNHTLNHIDLDKLKNNKLSHEINQSKNLLKKNLNIDVKHFSYPRGIYTKKSHNFIRKDYKSGVVIFDGKRLNKNITKNDFYKLKRIPIQRSDGKYLFVARIKGLLVLEEILRKLLILIKTPTKKAVKI